MGTIKKIEIMLIILGMSKKELATRMGITPANFSGKLNRNNFTESDLHAIAKACNVTYRGTFTITIDDEEIQI